MPDVLQQASQTIQKASDIIQKECQRCFKKYPLPDTFINRQYPQTCPECLKEESNRIRDRQSEKRAEEWTKLCPSAFSKTEFSSLPCQVAAKRTIEWKYGPSGLILHGSTGKGKSRSAWLLLKRLHSEGCSIQSLNSLAGLSYAALFSKSAAEVEKWVHSLISCDVLMMDDVFKIKLTDSFESIIFSVIDQRTESGRPLIVTANDTGETLANRLTADRSEPLLRRLREFCTAITFE